jgi:hypothetical protein
MIHCVTSCSMGDQLKKRVHFLEVAYEIEPQCYGSAVIEDNDAPNLIWYSRKDFARFEKHNRLLVHQYKSSLSKGGSSSSSSQRKGGTESPSTCDETSDDSYDELGFDEFNDSMSFYDGDSVQTVTPICLRGLENISSLRAKVSLLHRFRDYHTVILEEQKRQQSLGIRNPILLGEKAMAVSQTSKVIALNNAKDDADFAKQYCSNSSHVPTAQQFELILRHKVFNDCPTVETKVTTSGGYNSKSKIVSTQSLNVAKKTKEHEKKSSFFGFAPVPKHAVQIEFQLEDDEQSTSVRSTRSTFSAKLGRIRDRMTKGNGRKSKHHTDNENESRCSAATEPLRPLPTRNRKGHHSVAKSVYTPPVSSASFMAAPQQIKHTNAKSLLGEYTESTTDLDEDNDLFPETIVDLSSRNMNTSRNRRKDGASAGVKGKHIEWQPPSALSSSIPTIPERTPFYSVRRDEINAKAPLYVYTPETSVSSFNSSVTSSSRSSSLTSIGSKDGSGILKYTSAYKPEEVVYNISYLENTRCSTQNQTVDELASLHSVGDRIQI